MLSGTYRRSWLSMNDAGEMGFLADTGMNLFSLHVNFRLVCKVMAQVIIHCCRAFILEYIVSFFSSMYYKNSVKIEKTLILKYIAISRLFLLKATKKQQTLKIVSFQNDSKLNWYSILDDQPITEVNSYSSFLIGLHSYLTSKTDLNNLIYLLFRACKEHFQLLFTNQFSTSGKVNKFVQLKPEYKGWSTLQWNAIVPASYSKIRYFFILQSLTTSKMRKFQTLKLSQFHKEKTCWTENWWSSGIMSNF